jgi:hypothetical protein
VLLAFLIACGGPPSTPDPDPDPDPALTGAALAIVSPAPGARVSGAVFFAVQVLDARELEGIELYVGGERVLPTFPGETPMRVFLVPGDHPEGPLELRAVLRSGGELHERRTTVEVVRQPPSSATVGAAGTVVGDTEVGGAVSTVSIPAGVATGASVAFETFTQAEILALTGVDYDGLGVTFLGAQEIRSTQPTGDGVAVTSGGFGPMVQPGQTVVNYRIAPDMGRGVGELVVINGAAVAPNGDVLSAPPIVPQGGEGLATSALGTQALAVHGAGGLRRAASLPDGPPGTFIEVFATGLNVYAVDGYYARFRVGSTTVEVPLTIGLDGTARQYLFAVVPDLPPGPATVDLVWKLGDTVFARYEMNVTAPQPFTGSAKAIVDANYAALLEHLDEADLDFAGLGMALDFGPLRTAIAAARADYAGRADADPELVALARSLFNGGLLPSAIAASGVGTSQTSALCLLNGFKYINDKELARRAFRGDQMETGLRGLGADLSLDYLNRFVERLEGQDEYDCDPYEKFLCEELGNCGEEDVVEPWDVDAPNDPLPRPQRTPPGSAPTEWYTGMGSAAWPGGPVGGSFSDDTSTSMTSIVRAQDGGSLRPAAVSRVEAGRYTVRALANGAPLPFSNVVHEDGYFFLPLLPALQPAQLIFTDQETLRECVVDTTGRAVGSAVALRVDFAACAGDPVDPGDYTIRWVGGFSPFWYHAQNWDPARVPDANDDVYIPGIASEVFLPSGFEYQPPQVVQVRSLRSDGTVAFGNTTFQATGDVQLGVYRLDFPGPTAVQVGGTFTYDGLYVGVPSGFTLPAADVTLDTVTVTSRLVVPGTLTVTDGLFVLGGGVLAGAGTTIVPVGADGRVDLSAPTPTRSGSLDGHTLEVRGTFTLAEGQDGGNGTSFGLFNGAQARVAPGGVFRASGLAIVTGSAGGTLVNEGRVEIEAPVVAPETRVLVFSAVTLDNRGVVEVAGGATLAVDGVLRNAAAGELTGGGATTIDFGGVAEFTGGAISGGHTLVNQAGATGGGGTTWVATGAAPLTLAVGSEIRNAPNPFNATLSTFTVANGQPLLGGGTFRNQAVLTKTAGGTSDWTAVCYVEEGAGQLNGSITVGTCPP